MNPKFAEKIETLNSPTKTIEKKRSLHKTLGISFHNVPTPLGRLSVTKSIE